MASSVTSASPAWNDHYYLQSAASTHRRTIAKVTSVANSIPNTAQFCAAFANTNLVELFSLDVPAGLSTTDAPKQGTTTTRVVSISKKPS